MSTLYELTAEYMQLLQMLEDPEEDERVIMDTIEGVDYELEIKADNYAKIIRELSEEAKKFEAEKKRLEMRQTTLENRVKMLKDNLFRAMKETGKTKFKTELFSFGIQRNGGTQPMEIIPDVPVPAEYCRMEPDNAKIREALTAGKNLPFAQLLERGEHLRIR